MQPSLKIVIVDENPIRAAILEDGLREAGHVHVVRVDEMSHLLARIYTIDPDVILIDLENPSRDVLEQMFQVSRAVRRPVAMFVDQSDTASIEAAVDAGVSAYIVGGLQKARIKNILDLCISLIWTTPVNPASRNPSCRIAARIGLSSTMTIFGDDSALIVHSKARHSLHSPRRAKPQTLVIAIKWD